MVEKKRPEIDRVRLVDFTENDLTVYREWFLESDPLRQTCRPLGDLSLEAMIERFHKRSESETAHHFTIRRIDDDSFIGRTTYFDLNLRNRVVEIGFLIGPVFRRQGYAAEAVTLLLKHLFDELKLNKAMAQTAEFNRPAIALLEKFGFKQDGRLRRHHPLGDVYHDALIFSLLADEFQDASQ